MNLMRWMPRTHVTKMPWRQSWQRYAVVRCSRSVTATRTSKSKGAALSWTKSTAWAPVRKENVFFLSFLTSVHKYASIWVTGDRGGSPELIKTIKNSRTPIICICNDRQKNNVRTLANHCYDLKFQRPPKVCNSCASTIQQRATYMLWDGGITYLQATIAKRVTQLAHQHGLTVEENAMEYLVESVGNDIRQVSRKDA